MYSLPHRSRINNYFPAGYQALTDISELERVISNSTYQGGHGYLAGEFPGGITSVEGAPVSATIRVLLRVPGYNADGETVAEVQSAPDGTWLIQNLNENLKYDVVGRKEDFNDVIVTGVTPTSMVVITYIDGILPDETFTGALGYTELVGGIPPYAASVVDPLPAGLFPVVDGHQLIIDGTTTDDDVFNSIVRITSSNGATEYVPVKLVVGFKAPANFEAETLEVAGVFSMILTWGVTNSTQEVLVFRSTTPFDLESMPAPIATLTGDAVSYTDDDVIEDDVFYYMTASVSESFTLYSDEVRAVVGGDPHWDNVVALFHFEDSIADEKGGSYSPAGTIGYAEGKFGRCMNLSTGDSGVVEPTVNAALDLPGDFTIEGWMRPDAGSSGTFINRFALNSGWQLYLESNGSISFYQANGNNYPIYQAGPDLRDGQWHHIAATRQGSSLRMFVDGVVVGATSNEIDYTYYMPLLSIGFQAQGQARYPMRGDIDDVRITKGVARYTENFTPPTKPFPNK